MEERIVRTMRQQAWERAKGELRCVLITFWNYAEDDGKFDVLDDLVKKFIAEVEDNALAE